MSRAQLLPLFSKKDILLALPSTCLRKLLASRHLHCRHPRPRGHHPSLDCCGCLLTDVSASPLASLMGCSTPAASRSYYTIIIAVLQMEKLRLRMGRCTARGPLSPDQN